jgi:hypothetical protein
VGYYNTFVVKIWCDNCGQMVRGRVQHVHSHEMLHFLDMTSMVVFMQNHLQVPIGEIVNIDRGNGNITPILQDFNGGESDG